MGGGEREEESGMGKGETVKKINTLGWKEEKREREREKENEHCD